MRTQAIFIKERVLYKIDKVNIDMVLILMICTNAIYGISFTILMRFLLSICEDEF